MCIKVFSSRSCIGSAAVLSLAFLLLAHGCKKDGDGGATGTATASANGDKSGDDGKPKAKPSIRPKLKPHRALLGEATRAQLDIGGVFVDFGTADQHKYTRGGWGTGWGDSKKDGTTTYAEVSSKKAKATIFIPQGGVGEVVLRAKSAVAGQKVAVMYDSKALGSGDIATSWGLTRIAVTGIEPGVHSVDLLFGKGAGGASRAEIDWMWLAREKGAAEPTVLPRVLPMGKRRALVAPDSRSYSFFIEPPESASLVVDHLSEGGSKFVVRAESNDGKIEDLLSVDGTSDWQEAKVDLAKFAGQAIRLELSTVGGDGTKSGWGEPEIMVAPPADAGAVDALAGGAKPKNVIVILIDTVRADMFEAYNPGNKVETPAYDEFAKTSVVFRNAYNQENWTKPSVATLLSSLYPVTHKTKQDASSVPAEIQILPEHLKKQGFATAGFVANGYVSGKFGFEKGWDVFKNYIRESKPSDAEYVYGDSLQWLDENKDKPFFLYIQTIDPHVVYRVDRSYSERYFADNYSGPLGPTIDGEEMASLSNGKLSHSATDLEWIKALYRGEVSYHDEHMGKFFAELEKRGIFDNTLVVITNDHGEEHADHGKFGHGHSLWDELLRAPLLMHYPPLFGSGRTLTEVVEQVDVSPTILDVLGLPPMKNSEGLSLLPLVHGKSDGAPYYAVSEFLEAKRAIHVGSWKLEYSKGNLLRLFNVVADPNEQEEVTDASPVALAMCNVHIGESIASPDKRQRLADVATKLDFKSSDAVIDPETRKQLEALGYFGGTN